MFKIISVVIGFLLLGLDQWSKQWAITHLEGAGTVPALPGLFAAYRGDGRYAAGYHHLHGGQAQKNGQHGLPFADTGGIRRRRESY